MFTRLAISVSLLTSIALTSVSASTYYVDQATGDDTKAGTETAPMKSIQAAVDKLQPGDEVLIKDGIYRETVTVKAMGTAEAPIAIKAAPGAHPVISGAEQITDWKPCPDQDFASGNPLYRGIGWVEIDWEPTELFEDDSTQPKSQTPNEGWWPTEETVGNTVRDSKNLKGDIVKPDSTLFFFQHKGVSFHSKTITGFDNSTGTITVDGDVSKGTFTPGADRYRLENHVAYIDKPGEWAVVKSGEDAAAKYRIFYMPASGHFASAMIEIPKRLRGVVLSQTSYCTVEGLEITKHSVNGKQADAAIGNDVDPSVAGAGQHNSIIFCNIHHNGRFAIQGSGYDQLIIKNNVVYRNGYGVTTSKQKGTLIENNEIFENYVDGMLITWNSDDVVLRNNYIHHHCLYGHPDNIQMYRGVNNALIEGNFILAAGQSVMMEQVDGVTFRNNVIAGAAANMIIMGHNNANDGTWERNTFALWCMSLFSFTGQDYSLSGNIMANNGGKVFYGVPDKGSFESSQNLLYQTPGIKYGILATSKAGGKSQSFKSIEEMEAAGLESGSIMEDPQFKNAPYSIADLNPKKIGDCTTDTLYYDSGAPGFSINDYVEIHFDGVPRRVTSVDTTANSITISPALDDRPDRNLFIANWKGNKNFDLDFGSPFNNQFGSTIDTLAYKRGDFNGDGKRDIPVYSDKR